MALPPLQLSSGPAVSGGPTSSGGGATGSFTYHRNNTSWQETAAKILPLALVAGVALWVWKR